MLSLEFPSRGIHSEGQLHTRQVFPAFIANDIVDVQPMSIPSGLIFYLDYQYRNIKNEMKRTDLGLPHQGLHSQDQGRSDHSLVIPSFEQDFV